MSNNYITLQVKNICNLLKLSQNKPNLFILRAVEEYVAVPLFHILDENNFHKLVPAAACMLMLTVTGGFLELFPELYRIIVRFATSEWRILTKQIAYESSDSGNPVLAVFIAGE